MKTDEEREEADPADQALYSEFERKCSTGRFILKSTRKLSIKHQETVISADYSANSKMLVLGFSNGTFMCFDLDTME